MKIYTYNCFYIFMCVYIYIDKLKKNIELELCLTLLYKDCHVKAMLLCLVRLDSGLHDWLCMLQSNLPMVTNTHLSLWNIFSFLWCLYTLMKLIVGAVCCSWEFILSSGVCLVILEGGLRPHSFLMRLLVGALCCSWGLLLSSGACLVVLEGGLRPPSF